MNKETSVDIVKKLEEISQNMTKDKIENASKEELIEYLRQVDEIKALIKTAVDL